MKAHEALMKEPEFPFGACPECHKPGELLFVGEDNWYVCPEHQVCWYAGNCFSPRGTKDEWEANRQRIESYRKVEPYIGGAVPIDFVRGRRDEVLADALAAYYVDPHSEAEAAVGVAHQLGLLDQFEKAIAKLRRRRDEKAAQERRDREGFDSRLAEVLAHYRALSEAVAE